jgi:hypothetical protein
MVFPSRGNALTRGNGMKEREKNVCKLVCIFYDLISHVYFNSKRNGFSFKEKCSNKGKWNERMKEKCT